MTREELPWIGGVTACFGKDVGDVRVLSTSPTANRHLATEVDAS